MSSPKITFPDSSSTVRVRMVDTTTHMRSVSLSFIDPVPPGHEHINITDVAFLVENESLGKKVMFDLGVRKDYWNLPAVIQKRLGGIIPALRVDRDVTEILEEKGVGLEEISSVIWSHYHWDHTGNVSLFPPSTSVVVGPGFKASPNLLPGFPEKTNSPISATDIKGRELVEIDFEKSGLRIGGFAAHDFFGDGSFYLLDTPGHCLGHMCGLARTTASPEATFVLMGGDICHFAGDFRPTPSIPLPDPVPSDVLDAEARAYFPSPCPCSLFTDNHPMVLEKEHVDDARTTPFYRVSSHPTSAYVKPKVAQNSVNELAHFDACPDCFVCIAHDATLLWHVPTLNDEPESDLKAWKRDGLKEKCHWGWLTELPRKGKPGKEAIVEGFWRDGKIWDEAKAVLSKNGEKATGTGL